MFKRLSTLALLVFTSLTAFSQIHFINKPSWPQVLKQAQKEKKLIFLHLEDSKCGQCNEVATQGFNNTALTEKYSLHFISVRLDTETPEGKSVGDRLNYKGGPLSLYLDADENILARFPGTTSFPIKYLELADQAIAQSKKVGSIAELEKKYRAGDKSRTLLEKLIPARRELSKEYEGLLDEYIGQCTIDTLQSVRVVKFLLQQGLPIGSKARNNLYAVNGKNFKPGQRFTNHVDSIFYFIPYPERVTLNRQVIDKGFEKAVKEKNQNFLYQVTNFLMHTYSPDYSMGNLMHQRMIMNYHRQTKDTLQFLQHSQHYATALVLQANVDSLKKKDERLYQQRAKQSGNGGSFSYSPPSQWYYTELNSVAWSYWEMAKYTENLEKALGWSKKSIELYEKLRPANAVNSGQQAAFLDTYAHLLYKMGRRDEAIEWQTKAVEAQKEASMPSKTIDEALSKMKAGTLR